MNNKLATLSLYLTERVINAICDFNQRAQFLERNYYYANDWLCERDPRFNATLQLRSQMNILPYFKQFNGNNFPTPDEAGLSASIAKEVNNSLERAITCNRRAPNNSVINKCDRPI